MRNLVIDIIAGARPNFMKIAPMQAITTRQRAGGVLDIVSFIRGSTMIRECREISLRSGNPRTGCESLFGYSSGANRGHHDSV